MAFAAAAAERPRGVLIFLQTTGRLGIQCVRRALIMNVRLRIRGPPGLRQDRRRAMRFFMHIPMLPYAYRRYLEYRYTLVY